MTNTETTEVAKCVPHGTATLVRCAQCETPVCPKCAVWTAGGQKCPKCGGGKQQATGVRRWAPIAVLVVGVLAVVLGLLYLGSNAFKSSGGSESVAAVAPGSMGEEVTDGGMAFTVERFECADQTLEFQGETATARGKFCFVTIQVRNDGRRDAVFFGGVQYLIDTRGRRYDADAEATIFYLKPTDELEEEDLFFAAELGPDDETTGVLVFDVAETADINEIELHAADLGDLDGLSPALGRGVSVTLKSSPATTTSSPPSTGPEATTPEPSNAPVSAPAPGPDG